MAEQQPPTSTFRVVIDGSPLPDHVERLMVSAVIDDNLNLPDLFTLTFRDPMRGVLDDAKVKIGSKVKVSIVTEATPSGEPLISGEVTALEAEVDPTGTFTVVRGYDESHRLFRGRVTETYTNATYADIARKVAKRANLDTGQIDPTSPVHKHVSQANLNDWQFLQRLAREVGYEVLVEDGKLDFRAPVNSTGAPGQARLSSEDPFQLVAGANLLRLRATVTAAEQVKDVKVRGWDVSQKQALVGSAPAATTSASLDVAPSDLAGKFGAPSYVGVNVPYGAQAEVDAAAKALAEQIAGAFAELDGVARGNPRLKAGAPVSLSLVGQPFDGKYTLTSSRHVYEPHTGYTTMFVVSGRQERSLLGLVSGGASGSGNGAPPPYPGVVSAQVTDVNDPDSLGRVKVKFPWLSDTYVSDWARTVHPGAGSNRGAVVLPEVNDEVLVAFEQGDVRRPYVVGGLYNGVDKPKLGNGLIDGSTGAVKRRGFVSKKGHLLVFFDDDADSGVALLTGDGKLKVSLNDSKTTVHVSSDGKVVIEGSQDVEISAGASMHLEAKAALELKGKTVSISADGTVDVSGKMIKLN
jgi:phage protein D/phage baseplate assembly protein gpV